MENWTTAALIWIACGSALAQDVGRVVSATPVVQQVAAPRQVCSMEQISYQGPKSGAGALLGALAGGAVGNAAGGRGAGQAAATAIGIMGGAILGDHMEGPGPERLENVQHCSVQNFYENRTVAYNVLYEFAGKQYSVQMPNDPGPTLALQITPVGTGVVAQAAPAPLAVQTAPTTYVTVQPQRGYYAPYYYQPLIVPFGFYGYGHEHRHW